NAPAAPPGVGTADPIIDQPSTNKICENPNGIPKARHTRRFAKAIDPQRSSDQKILIVNNLMSERTFNAAASCSSVLRRACLILLLNGEWALKRSSIQPMAEAERFSNQISRPTATMSPATKPNPIIRARPRCAALSAVGFNQSRFSANTSITVIVSYKRSIMIVTNDAAGLTRSSRIGRTTGRTTSPARPTSSTAPNPTVVATQTALSFAGVNGLRNARQRIARQT